MVLHRVLPILIAGECYTQPHTWLRCWVETAVVARMLMSTCPIKLVPIKMCCKDLSQLNQETSFWDEAY
jgi:hypothetical protein